MPELSTCWPHTHVHSLHIVAPRRSDTATHNGMSSSLVLTDEHGTACRKSPERGVAAAKSRARPVWFVQMTAPLHTSDLQPAHPMPSERYPSLDPGLLRHNLSATPDLPQRRVHRGCQTLRARKPYHDVIILSPRARAQWRNSVLSLTCNIFKCASLSSG